MSRLWRVQVRDERTGHLLGFVSLDIEAVSHSTGRLLYLPERQWDGADTILGMRVLETRQGFCLATSADLPQLRRIRMFSTVNEELAETAKAHFPAERFKRHNQQPIDLYWAIEELRLTASLFSEDGREREARVLESAAETFEAAARDVEPPRRLYRSTRDRGIVLDSDEVQR